MHCKGFGDAAMHGRDGTSDHAICTSVIKNECYADLALNSCDVVLDGGGNIGAFSVWASPKCRMIVALEPDDENFELFRLNCFENCVTNVVALEKALVGNDDETRLFYENLKTNKATHSLLVKRGRAEHEVRCESINFILAAFGVTKIKLDIEGGEYEVLMAIKKQVWEQIESIIFEYHFNMLKDKDHSKFREIITILTGVFPHVVYNRNLRKHFTTIVLAYR